MIQLHIQKRAHLDSLIAHRSGEQKMGELLDLCSSLDGILESRARFVLFGITESIGVQANYGNKGTHKAWDTFLRAFVNVQSNSHNDGRSILLLGHIDVTPDARIHSDTPRDELGKLVSRIDQKVALVVAKIVGAGKIPIIIGGGHNNAYGNIKGSTVALKHPINAINIDAHTDLRTADYRHSGNGFSYALQKEQGPLLTKYAVFGLHKNYTPQYIFEYMNTHSTHIHYDLFEDLLTQENIISKFESQLDFVDTEAFGLELDCDAIRDFPSSAQTPSGFELNTVRRLIIAAAKRRNCTYFHICEAAPSQKNQKQVGKALSYLVTDFIRSSQENHSF